MKTTLFYVFVASFFASVGAFAPVPLATRAVGKKADAGTKVIEKKAPTKKVVEKKPVVKKVAAKKPAAKKTPAKKPAAKKVVKKAKKVVAKKSVAKKASVKKVVTPVKKVKKSGPPPSGGYPSFRASTENWKPFAGISGGGNKAPVGGLKVPDFSDPKLQIKRDPKVYAAAAQKRKENLYGSEFVYDDGLTVLERKQRKTLPTFLTGSAKSQADESTIRSDIEADTLIFGLDPDRFQLLFISIFGLFALVGCLSGTLQL